MTRRPALLDIAGMVLVAAQLALALHIAVNGPTGAVPVHFGMDGTADRWGDRMEIAWMLAGLGALSAVVLAGMALAARRAGDDVARERGLRAGQFVSLVAFAGVTGLVGFTTLSGDAGGTSPQMQMAGTSLLFAAVGAWLGRVGPNVAVGIRTPWTYKSRLAWDRSNRLAGRLFLIVGLVGLTASAVAPQPLGMQALIVAVLGAAVLSIFESWRVWRADPERTPF
jgi:uncharacterized membrane protein